MKHTSHLDPNSPESAHGAGGDLVKRAADEIERLERVMQAITDACARWGWGHCTTERELIEQIDFTIQRAAAAEAEVARLREALKNESKAYKEGYNDGYSFYNKACAMKGACGDVAAIEVLTEKPDDA